MKKALALLLALLSLAALTGCREPEAEPEEALAAKPVIYLYPEDETEVTVRLDFDGQLTAVYPTYADGWTVLAEPDGTLTDLTTGREHYCLFWEGISAADYDLTTGAVVPGDQTDLFLEQALAALGLTPREANEFIIYWLPRMERNSYNLISFQQETYTDRAALDVTPAPDTVIRVFMAWQALEEPVAVPPQTMTAPAREGFTLVEWGGAEIR